MIFELMLEKIWRLAGERTPALDAVRLFEVSRGEVGRVATGRRARFTSSHAMMEVSGAEMPASDEWVAAIVDADSADGASTVLRCTTLGTMRGDRAGQARLIGTIEAILAPNQVLASGSRIGALHWIAYGCALPPPPPAGEMNEGPRGAGDAR